MTRAQRLGRLMYIAATCIGWLPLSIQRVLGDLGGRLAYALNTRETRVARRNLEIIAPDYSHVEREIEVNKILRATGKNAVETLRIWTRSRASNLRLIKHVYGSERLDAALAAGTGVIIAAPHYGNWELLIEYMATRVPFTLVYRVPEKPAGAVFLRMAREGLNVRLVPAEANAMRPLRKALAAGESVGITPDQQPKFGGGEFAPFFNKMALTLSLIPKLAERSGAPVLFAYAEPCAGGFTVHFEDSCPDIVSPNLSEATAIMNAHVETIARRNLSQYQWTYKRYTLRPPGSGEDNPYHPDCY